MGDMLNGGGLAAAAASACPTTPGCGLSSKLKATAEDLKSQGSFLGYVNCMAAAATVQCENPVMNLYHAVAFGARGATLKSLGEAAKGADLGIAVGKQVAAFTGNAADAA